MKVHRKHFRSLFTRIHDSSRKLDLLDKELAPYGVVRDLENEREVCLAQLPMYTSELLHLLDLTKRKSRQETH